MRENASASITFLSLAARTQRPNMPPRFRIAFRQNRTVLAAASVTRGDAKIDYRRYARVPSPSVTEGTTRQWRPLAASRVARPVHFPCSLDRRTRQPSTLTCVSFSILPLGKGEVVSSILTGSTTTSPSASRRARVHLRVL